MAAQRHYTLAERKLLPYLLEGDKTQTEISKETGYSQSYISEVANRRHIKALVEESQIRFIEGSLEKAVDNQSRMIDLAYKLLNCEELKEEDKLDGVKKVDVLKLGLKAGRDLLQSVGILSTPRTSPVYNAQINITDPKTAEEVKEVGAFLRWQMKQVIEKDESLQRELEKNTYIPDTHAVQKNNSPDVNSELDEPDGPEYLDDPADDDEDDYHNM